MDELSLRLDDNEELNALTLTTLLNSGVEEALSNLTPEQLILLERNVQRLKHQKTPVSAADAASAGMLSSGKSSVVSSGHASGTSSARKRRGSNEGSVGSVSDRPRPTGGQYMNLPASTPHVEYREGMEWLIFTYSTKGHIQEYHIRADLDDIGAEEIPDDFKMENCVYPRALVPREAYIGNRYDYETIVNEIAWKLCWRNPGVLNGKRGLIQRAVDSYRNRTAECRSRRVMRQEKLHAQSPYAKRAAMLDGHDGSQPMSMIRVPGPKTLTLQYADREGETTKIKIRVDIEGVDLALVDDDFRASNAVYVQAMIGGGPEYTNERWEYENACNELGWKLAWLNSAKLAGKRALLHKAVEAYHARMEAADRARQAVLQHHQHLSDGSYDPNGAMMYHQQHDHDGSMGGILEKNEEFNQMVAHTLQQAISQGTMPSGDLSGYGQSGYMPQGYGGYMPHPSQMPQVPGMDDAQYQMYAIHQMQLQMQQQEQPDYDEAVELPPLEDENVNGNQSAEDVDVTDEIAAGKATPQTVSTAELLGSI